METVFEQASGRVLTRRYGGELGGPALHEERFEYLSDTASPWPDRQILRESVPGRAEMVETFRTRFVRDVRGRVLRATRSDGEERFTLYDRSSDDVLRLRTSAGTEESYSRDGRGLPIRVTRPNGRGHTLYTYDLDGVRLAEGTATADGESLWTTTYTHDATGRVTAVDYADGTHEERTYAADSQVATVETRDGLTLTFDYDAANRLESVTPSADGSTTTLLDGGDAYAYDELSRPTLLERGRPGRTGMAPSLSVEYPSYDLASRPTSEVVGEREALSWSYDVFSNPTEVTLPAGAGRAAGGAFTGFTRSFDTLDRLTAAGGLGSAGLSSTPLGADWSWGGASRLYGMTTRGALGTGMRLGYHGGGGPQVPGHRPGSASEWKLGRLSWGSIGNATPEGAPEVSWGDFGFGWRGREGTPSDGAKIGRQVLESASTVRAFADLGWSWDYDAGVRLREASAWAGDLDGADPPADEATDRFTFSYGEGDELLEAIREATGEVTDFEAGDYGRPTSRNGRAFRYDPVGRRLEDDRFVYRWDWRGQLVSVEVKATWPDGDDDGAPDASPYAGHRVRYDYDARGRLTRRLHEGAESGDGTQPFIEERRYVWENDRLAAEAAYGPTDTGENIRWRRTYVPGPSGLDDPPQVVVEVFQPGSPSSGEARTYTYLRDELGTVIGLVAEDEGTDPAHPPVPIRYRYTPYGAAHAETGPELHRARHDEEATEAETTSGTVTQTVADETTHATGALIVTWSLALDETTFETGLILEQLLPGSGWTPVPEADVAIGTRPSEGRGTATESTSLRVLLPEGWQRGRSYRLRLTPDLQDRLGRRFGATETLDWAIPVAEEDQPLPTVQYDQRFPTDYESYQAAGATAEGRFPTGQSRLFQGLWTDPVTGISYARARWYDARNATWLTEDPLFDINSPNLYAFVGWQPSMATDPLGLYQEDVHFYAIYYLSRTVGFSADEAFQVASASQYVDDSKTGSPLGAENYVRGRTAAFHFPAPSALTVEEGSVFARAPVREASEAKDLTRLGIALHTLADSFSHAGFKAEHSDDNVREGAWRPNFGHFDATHGGHGPDLPYEDVEKAMEMAQTVLEELEVAYSEIHGSQGSSIDRKQLMVDLEEAFSRSSEDSKLRSAYWQGLLFVRFDEDVEYDPNNPPPGFESALTVHEESVKSFTSFEENPYLVLDLP